MAVTATVLTEYLAKVPAKTQQKGRQIFDNQGDSDSYLDDTIELLSGGPRSAVYSVPSQSDDFSYEVKLSWTAKKLTARCDCLAYEDNGTCKHIVAAILELEQQDDTVERNAGIEEAQIVEETKTTVQAQAEEPARFEKRVFSTQPVHAFRNIDWNIGFRQPVGELRRISNVRINAEAASWDFTYAQSAKQRYYPRIEYDRQETFTLSCTCNAIKSVCTHLTAAANYLFYEFGGGAYFIQFRDYSKEREAALRKIGLSPYDPEAEAVVFKTDAWGTLSVQVPDWLLQPGKLQEKIGALVYSLALEKPDAGNDKSQEEPPAEIVPGFIFQTQSGFLPFGFEIVIINVAGNKFAKINSDNPDRIPELKATLPPEAFKAVLSITHSRLNKGLDEIGSLWKMPHGTPHMKREDRSYMLLYRRYAEALDALWPLLSDPETAVYTAAETQTHRKHSTRIQLSRTKLQAFIRLTKTGRLLELRPAFRNAETGAELTESISIIGNGLLLRGTDAWYLPQDEATRNLLRQFPAGFLKIPGTETDTVMKTLLPSLRSRYEVVLDPKLQPQLRRERPEPYLQLSEQGGRNLLLIPRFRYGAEDHSFAENPVSVPQTDASGQWYELQRDMDAERAFALTIRDLHPRFTESRSLQAFSIPFSEALQDSWYQKMIAALGEKGIEVRGIEALQHFRYNPHQAQVSVSSAEGGSGIDWFDLLIEISFGDQQVSLKEVRRALMNGQAGVRLQDGTIGLLPQEFISQYGALLKLGKEKGDGQLRLNKLHFTLIDSLHEAALSRDLRAEIAAKKAALQEIETIRTVDVPASVRASLRPYQLAGFQWMQVLDRLGWGGCLADDMGLGKTLQTITFLQHLKDRQPGSTNLVVCPTSLIYNWQSELEKFAPELRYHIHYGPGRVWNTDLLNDLDVVITTYGIVRSDLDALSAVSWHYVILDESQAIKNPEAQTTKAVQVLRAKNRLCLSGTPLQNNTFDLYAQFEFLNPGLLGSREFFRSEFATPIDKQGSDEARATLRKMLAPFMLRRKKEQVAKDLPDKTEVTLWCEMEAQQRAVYDEYRRYYRDSLLKRIDSEGMEGSAIYVLEALLRMRQLCDHPQLVKNDAVKTNDSIKLDELRREIGENAGGSKVLVFSQFTEMLGLIREAFDADGIKYAYLDGKTQASKRKEAVEKFQTDPELRVFLISLKAGGVGLNLTAAEYVYIVDPWWNPAVEAQAIDRTHRIGQTNKIVAYRMICKDTVEEKVLLLQSRKRALADGLVTEDAGFVKKLTRDDVAFLLG